MSEEELLLIRLTAEGLRPEQIGDRIASSRHTVRHHLDALRSRLGISTNAGLVCWAARRGLLAGEVLPAGRPPGASDLSSFFTERKAGPLRY